MGDRTNSDIEIEVSTVGLTDDHIDIYSFSDSLGTRNTSAFVSRTPDQYDPRRRPWYNVSIALYGDFTTHLPTVTLTANTIKDNGEFYGCAAVDIFLPLFGGFIRSFTPVASSPHGRLFVVTDEGEVIVTSNDLVFPHNNPVSSRNLTVMNGTCLPTNDPNTVAGVRTLFEYIGAYKDITDETVIRTDSMIVLARPVTIRSGSMAATWILVVSLPLESVYPQYTHKIGATLAIIVLGIAAVIVLIARARGGDDSAHGSDKQHEHDSHSHGGSHGHGNHDPVRVYALAALFALGGYGAPSWCIVLYFWDLAVCEIVVTILCCWCVMLIDRTITSVPSL